MGRRMFCEKDGISITYLDDNVAFEEVGTAESILFANDGTVLFNNFAADAERTQFFKDYFHRIYPYVVQMRELDALETVA